MQEYPSPYPCRMEQLFLSLEISYSLFMWDGRRKANQLLEQVLKWCSKLFNHYNAKTKTSFWKGVLWFNHTEQNLERNHYWNCIACVMHNSSLSFLPLNLWWDLPARHLWAMQWWPWTLAQHQQLFKTVFPSCLSHKNIKSGNMISLCLDFNKDTDQFHGSFMQINWLISAQYFGIGKCSTTVLNPDNPLLQSHPLICGLSITILSLFCSILAPLASKLITVILNKGNIPL